MLRSVKFWVIVPPLVVFLPADFLGGEFVCLFFRSQPERLESIIMAAVTVLALLISKVLDKARELSAKLFEKEMLQPIAEPNKGKTTQIIPQTDNPPKQETSEIPCFLQFRRRLEKSCLLCG